MDLWYFLLENQAKVQRDILLWFQYIFAVRSQVAWHCKFLEGKKYLKFERPNVIENHLIRNLAEISQNDKVKYQIP